MNTPESTIVEDGVIRPSCSAAIAVTGLNVEPVGYVAAIARLNSGAPLASEFSASYLRWESGLANTLASKLG